MSDNNDDNKIVKHGWPSGVSGNPGGRPRGVMDVRVLARAHTKEAIETLVEIMADKDARESARVAAAACILDRGWGRAPQTINLPNEGGAIRNGLNLAALSDTDLETVGAILRKTVI